jgi:Ala-tRNA(Pro) deacylase
MTNESGSHTPVFDRIRTLLDERKIVYRHIEHEPTYTSEESARARGESITVGGKAILMKVDADFRVFVLSAALKVDSKKIKDRFGAKKIRFASADELMEHCAVVPGCLPPFGRPVFDLPLYVDSSVAANTIIAFNAGSLTDSLILAIEDYLEVAQPEIFDFSSSDAPV